MYILSLSNPGKQVCLKQKNSVFTYIPPESLHNMQQTMLTFLCYTANEIF